MSIDSDRGIFFTPPAEGMRSAGGQSDSWSSGDSCGTAGDSCGTAVGRLGTWVHLPAIIGLSPPPFPVAASVCGERHAHSLGFAYSGNYTSGNNTQPDE